MEIRKIQRTGDMHYLYLPTSWCKEHSITSDSRVNLAKGGGGSLIITPTIQKKQPKHIELGLPENNLDIINKLVVACYINPADSFRITLEKPLDYRELLDQKRLLNVEFVEIENKGKTIVCESSIHAGEPDILLRTMVNKVNNLLVVMTKNPDKDLIQKYEEEVDRNRVMIDKAVIGSMTYKIESKLKIVDLYYIALIAKSMERLVDHCIVLDKNDAKFLEEVLEVIKSLKDVIDLAIDPQKKFDYHSAIQFSQKALAIKEEPITGIKSYHKVRIRRYLVNISEVLIDWAITNETEAV